MKFLRDRVNARRLRKAAAFTERIQSINARLDHIDGMTFDAQALREERARVWRARNDLYLKIDKE